MEEHVLLSPIPKHSNFEFPWSTHVLQDGLGCVVPKEARDRNRDPVYQKEAFGSTAMLWKVFSKDEDAGTVTIHLLRDSWCLFKGIHLKNWVEFVMGMPSMAIALLESYHNRLGYSLFTFICQFPQETAKYRSVAMAVRPTDRFLYATILNALECATSDKPFRKLSLDAPFLTAPLKSLLSRPGKDILRQLSTLETRYKRYRTGTAMAQGKEFQTDTKLLTSLTEESAVTVARRITQDTLAEFRKISYDGIMATDCHLKHLAGRWDSLFYESEEISAAGCLEASLSALARKELHYLRNFFSLFALLSGMSQAGIEPDPDLAEFVDAGANHRKYRLKLHMKPSLPFLYPFIKDLKRGNLAAVKDIFSFLLYGQFLQHLIG